MKYKITLLLAGILFALAATIGFADGGGLRQAHLIPTLTNDPNGIAEDQTTSASADLTLNGVLVTTYSSTALSTPCNPLGKNSGPYVCGEGAAAQKVSIEGTGNNSGITFTLLGTDADGWVQTEVLTGGNTVVVHSVLYYKTMDTVTASGAVTGNVEVGFLSAQGAVSGTLVPDLSGHTPLMSIAVQSCTCTYTVDHTSWGMPSTVEPAWFDTAELAGLGIDAEHNISAPVGGVRARITAYTSGSLTILILQAKTR